MKIIGSTPTEVDITIKLREELCKRDMQISLFRDVLLAIRDCLDLGDILQMIAISAQALIKAETILIPVIDDSGSTYTYRAGFGKNASDIVGESLDISLGICGWVWKHKRPWWRGVLTELSSDERNLWEKQIGNVILVPLVGRDNLLGGISGINKAGGADFDQEDLDILNLLASQAVIAIDNNMLIKNLRDSHQSLIEQHQAMDEAAIIAETDQTGKITFVNDKFCELSGYSREELIGSNHRIINSGTHPREFFINLWKTIAGGQAWHGEICNRTKDGSLYWVNTTIVPTMGYKEARPIKFIAICFDITYRQNLEMVLVAEKSKLAVTLHSIGDGVITTDSVGNINFLNPVAEQLTGWKLKDAAGLPLQMVFRIINEYSRKTVENPVDQVLRDGVVVGLANHTLLISSDGTERPIADSAAPIYSEVEGQILGAVLVFRDQTEEKKFTLDIEDKQKTLRAILDHVPMGIWMTEANGHIVLINKTFCEAVGIAEERFKEAAHYTDVLGADIAANCMASDAAALVSDEPYISHEKLRLIDGRLHDLEIIKVRISGQEGMPPRLIGLTLDITDRMEQASRLEHMAHYDPLTNLPNRSTLADRFTIAKAGIDRDGGILAVCYLDLDGFKAVNDLRGHAVGDQLLIEASERMQKSVRGTDTVSRLGGDEFVLLLAGFSETEECSLFISRLLTLVAEPYLIGGHSIRISASIGATLYPGDKSDFDTLLRHADLAMYQAKQSGRDRYHFFNHSLDSETQSLLIAIERIREALHNGEFRLHYQPKVNMRTGQIIGMEALIRWQHPERGLLAPIEFLPLIEQTDLILEVDEWVIEEVLRQIELWQGQSFPSCSTCRISLNITGRHLMFPEFVEVMKAAFSRHPEVLPQQIDIEVLETAAIEDSQQVALTMAKCAELGVTFSIDDFGTGYSSLSYLKSLPAHNLKIDQSFIRDMLDDSNGMALVEAVIALGRVFQREVIAEGVENIEQGILLMRMGCDLAQGYGIAKPMPEENIPSWVRDFKPDPAWALWADSKWELSDFPLLVAQYDHLHWVKRIMYAIDGVRHGLSVAELTDHTQCRFGHWYYGHGKDHYSHLEEYAAIEPIHCEVHRIGPEILRLRDEGDMDAARKYFLYLLSLKDQILAHLSLLQLAILHSLHLKDVETFDGDHQ